MNKRSELQTSKGSTHSLGMESHWDEAVLSAKVEKTKLSRFVCSVSGWS